MATKIKFSFIRMLGIIILGFIICNVSAQNNDTIIVTEDTTIYQFVEKKPQFPGGEKEMMKFLIHNINYSVVTGDEILGTKTICRFVVEKSGEITNIEILKSAGKSLDEAVIELIKKMPNWIPAKKDNKIVRAYFTLPVHVELRK